MAKYTLTSYEPVHIELPKPQVPDSLVDSQIDKLLEPLAEFHEIAEERPVKMGDVLVVTTENACIDGNPAKNFILEHSVYRTGAGEMPRTFDDELVGMEVGQTKDVVAKIKLPLSKDDDPSSLTMKVLVEKILYCVQPELTDELVQKHFAPATTVAEFREGVAGQFGAKDMRKNDPQFPDLVLEKLAERLVEQPDESDRMEGMPQDALRATCAIDALADFLELELSDDDVTAQMPGDDAEQRAKIRAQLEEQGLSDAARVFARREAALSWLVNNSRVSYE